MSLWVCFWIFIGVMFIVGIVQAINKSERRQSIESHLGALKDFTATQKIIGEDANTGLAVDEQRRKFCLITHGPSGTKYRVLEYADLISSEVFEDGTAVTRTVRSSQVGGAVVGGLLLGGVGALIGGLSGKTETTGKVKSVDLRLTVNDTTKPTHDVKFMGIEDKKGGTVYKSAMEKARHWHGLMEVLIKRADIEDKAKLAHSSSQPTGSLADELKKLADLRDAGVLNAEEFQREKARLLA